MQKSKVIFPESVTYHSPYQLEDCLRRLKCLKRDMRPLTFCQLDADRIAFGIRHVEIQNTSTPMIAFEVQGTLRRWGGTGTRLEGYRLYRFSKRTDTWVIAFVIASFIMALVMMVPSHITLSWMVQLVMVAIAMLMCVGLAPYLLSVRKTFTIDIEQDIDNLHLSIMKALNIIPRD